MNLIAVIPAAGKSERLGLEKPKPLLEVAGIPMILRTAQILHSCRSIEEIVVAINPDWRQEFEAVLARFSGRYSLIDGGASRQASVKGALEFLAARGVPPTHVLIHDAARCLLPEAVLERILDELRRSDIVTAGIPVSDSLKRLGGAQIENVERENLWSIQTPQAFRFDLLLAAHRAAPGVFTDDTAVVESYLGSECALAIVNGDPLNFKVTTPSDFSLACRLAATLPPHDVPEF